MFLKASPLKFISFVVSVSILMLSACSPASSAISVTETQSNIKVTEEIIHMNNCGGKANSTQTAARSFSSNVEGEITGKVGYEVVEGSVSAKYGQYRTISKNQELIAPPQTNMEFTLRWTEQEWLGTLISNNTSGTYTAHAPLSVDLTSSQDLGCGETAAQPTEIIVISSTQTVPMDSSVIPTQPVQTYSAQVEFLGEWIYQASRPAMPPPAGQEQVVFAHGDINNTGTCHVKKFGPGELVQGLGGGSFKLWLITGTQEQIDAEMTTLQNGAAAHAGTACPFLP
jgi:hypothetical protein